MNHLEAVDAKLERARGQSRRLKEDARDFCRERSRLILPAGAVWRAPAVGLPGRRVRPAPGVVDRGWGVRLQPALGAGPAGVAAGGGPRQLRR